MNELPMRPAVWRDCLHLFPNSTSAHRLQVIGRPFERDLKIKLDGCRHNLGDTQNQTV